MSRKLPSDRHNSAFERVSGEIRIDRNFYRFLSDRCEMVLTRDYPGIEEMIREASMRRRAQRGLPLPGRQTVPPREQGLSGGPFSGRLATNRGSQALPINDCASAGPTTRS